MRLEQSDMERSKPLRLVIDTNLWISFVISNKLNMLDDFLKSSNAILLFSPELIDEITKTVFKPKLKSFFPSGAVDEMFKIIEPFSEMVKPTSKVTICRDPNDDFLLTLSKDGNADFLVTGDKDLLAIQQYKTTRIITFSELATTLKLT